MLADNKMLQPGQLQYVELQVQAFEGVCAVTAELRKDWRDIGGHWGGMYRTIDLFKGDIVLRIQQDKDEKSETYQMWQWSLWNDTGSQKHYAGGNLMTKDIEEAKVHAHLCYSQIMLNSMSVKTVRKEEGKVS